MFYAGPPMEISGPASVLDRALTGYTILCIIASVFDRSTHNAESPVTAKPEDRPQFDDSSMGPSFHVVNGKLRLIAKSPNTPRESRAVNNAGERTEGKS